MLVLGIFYLWTNRKGCKENEPFVDFLTLKTRLFNLFLDLVWTLLKRFCWKCFPSVGYTSPDSPVTKFLTVFHPFEFKCCLVISVKAANCLELTKQYKNVPSSCAFDLCHFRSNCSNNHHNLNPRSRRAVGHSSHVLFGCSWLSAQRCLHDKKSWVRWEPPVVARRLSCS